MIVVVFQLWWNIRSGRWSSVFSLKPHQFDSKAVWLVSKSVLNSPVALGFQQVLHVVLVVEQLVVLKVVMVVKVDVLHLEVVVLRHPKLQSRCLLLDRQRSGWQVVVVVVLRVVVVVIQVVRHLELAFVIELLAFGWVSSQV